jgi:hypothetical protein
VVDVGTAPLLFMVRAGNGCCCRDWLWSPPYMHDGRLLTLEDTVEFFNLLLGTKLMATRSRDLVAFLRAL